MRWRRLIRRPIVIGIATTVAVGTAGIALGAIPDSAGVYTACYSKTSSPVGQLRVIDPSAGQTCSTSETQITWNAKGINWTGAWISTRAYNVGDAVSRYGSSYLAIAANTNHRPPNATYWGVLASKGAAGAPGAAGTDGVTYFARRDVSGPLPASLTFPNVPAGTAIVRTEGTAFASTVGTHWITVAVGGANLCSSSTTYFPDLYFNSLNQHLELRPMTWKVCFDTPASHTVTLTASDAGLQSDANDVFSVTVTVYGAGATVDG